MPSQGRAPSGPDRGGFVNWRGKTHHTQRGSTLSQQHALKDTPILPFCPSIENTRLSEQIASTLPALANGPALGVALPVHEDRVGLIPEASATIDHLGLTEVCATGQGSYIANEFPLRNI